MDVLWRHVLTAEAIFIMVIRLYNLHTVQLPSTPAWLPRAAVTDIVCRLQPNIHVSPLVSWLAYFLFHEAELQP